MNSPLLSSLLVFAIAYICGSCPSGYLLGRLKGIDIRQHGSHNIGATNVRRILGRKWSIICFFMDFLKGFLPVLLVGHSLATNWGCGAIYGGLIAAAGSICGHIFPVWLKFKGGKGVATSLGVALALAYWPVIWAGLAWVILFYSTRIVAIASIAAVLVMAGTAWLHHFCFNNCFPEVQTPEAILFSLIAVVVILCHHENIGRLIRGEENSFKK